MTADDLNWFVRELATDTKVFVTTHVARAVKEGHSDADAKLAADLLALRADCAALKKQLDEVAARPTGLRYCGVWQSGVKYRQDDGVTYDGCLWVAKRNHVMSEPMEDPTAWQLCAKKGRDGRDRERKEGR